LTLRPSSFAAIWVKGQKERILTGYEVEDNKGESTKTRAINTKIGRTDDTSLGGLEKNSGTRIVAGTKSSITITRNISVTKKVNSHQLVKVVTD
jgi:hypothetical protein